VSSGLNFLLSMKVHCSAHSEPRGSGTSLDLESCGNEFLVLLYYCVHEPVASMIFGLHYSKNIHKRLIGKNLDVKIAF
jgi:hypothetical protein